MTQMPGIVLLGSRGDVAEIRDLQTVLANDTLTRMHTAVYGSSALFSCVDGQDNQWSIYILRSR